MTIVLGKSSKEKKKLYLILWMTEPLAFTPYAIPLLSFFCLVDD